QTGSTAGTTGPLGQRPGPIARGPKGGGGAEAFARRHGSCYRPEHGPQRNGRRRPAPPRHGTTARIVEGKYRMSRLFGVRRWSPLWMMERKRRPTPHSKDTTASK